MDSNNVEGYSGGCAVYFLAHPVMGDSKVSYNENLKSILFHTKLLRECGINAVPTYYADLMCWDETPNEILTNCYAVDEQIILALGHIVLCGHKLSKGMSRELDALPVGGNVINLIGMSEAQIRSLLILR